MDIQVLFSGTEKDAYRDPACCFGRGEYQLFFTHSVLEDDGYMYNYVAYAHGPSLDELSAPIHITEKDHLKNFCSPGCILRVENRFLIPCCSYPLPEPYRKNATATDDARLYLIETEDFKNYSAPQPILAKGDLPLNAIGRMIDPYIFRDKDDEGLYHLFFKQNGVSHSVSRDLKNWTYLGRIDGGENASVYLKDGWYHLYHSPKNGIGHKCSKDLVEWQDLGVSTLDQEHLPWASGRITAGFFMEAGESDAKTIEAGAQKKAPYLLFFHGSREDCPPETHGAATLAVLYLESIEIV